MLVPARKVGAGKWMGGGRVKVFVLARCTMHKAVGRNQKKVGQPGQGEREWALLSILEGTDN